MSQLIRQGKLTDAFRPFTGDVFISSRFILAADTLRYYLYHKNYITMNIISETRKIENVSRVVLREYGQLFISQGDRESLSLEGQDDVLSMVRSDVRNGELLLDIEGGWWDRTWRAITSTVEGKPLKYHLTLKKLDGLFVSGAARVRSKGFRFENFQMIMKGAGEIVMTDIEAVNLDIEMPGAGLINLSGSAENQKVWIKGAGSYDCPRLKTDNAEVKLHGVGRARVWAVKSLDARVDGVGHIEYYGEPDVRRSVSGLGKISQTR